jgi:hypothetical protein
MALGIYFAHEGFTPEKYDSAIKKLDAAGVGNPNLDHSSGLCRDGSSLVDRSVESMMAV